MTDGPVNAIPQKQCDALKELMKRSKAWHFRARHRRQEQEEMKKGDPEKPWENVALYKHELRRHKIEELKRLELFRSWVMEAAGPWLMSVEKRIKAEKSFNLQDVEIFTAVQTLLVAVPNKVADINKLLEAMAKVTGHHRGPPEKEPERITDESLQRALVGMLERAQKIKLAQAQAIEAEVVNVEEDEPRTDG